MGDKHDRERRIIREAHLTAVTSEAAFELLKKKLAEIDPKHRGKLIIGIPAELFEVNLADLNVGPDIAIKLKGM